MIAALLVIGYLVGGLVTLAIAVRWEGSIDCRDSDGPFLAVLLLVGWPALVGGLLVHGIGRLALKVVGR